MKDSRGALTKAKANLLVHELEGRKRLLHLPSTAGPSLSSPFSERFFQHLSDILLPPGAGSATEASQR